jgi:hypothetical protein
MGFCRGHGRWTLHAKLGGRFGGPLDCAIVGVVEEGDVCACLGEGGSHRKADAGARARDDCGLAGEGEEREDGVAVPGDIFLDDGRHWFLLKLLRRRRTVKVGGKLFIPAAAAECGEDASSYDDCCQHRHVGIDSSFELSFRLSILGCT